MNPFVHLIRMPDERDVCFTGKEKVNPRSLLLSGVFSDSSSSFSTNSFNDKAIKSKSSYIQKKKTHQCALREQAYRFVINYGLVWDVKMRSPR